MARIKIDYGIDLGTTNSAICRMEKGEPVIIKTDVLKIFFFGILRDSHAAGISQRLYA